MEKEKITVSGTINAPIEKVWTYWTEPEHIINWNFASEDWHCPHATNDLRVGGIYSARMEAKDGSFGFDFTTVYDEIIDQQLISYSMEDGRRAVTTFEEHADGTRVTTVFDAEGQNPIEFQKAGWQAILDHFKQYTETH